MYDTLITGGHLLTMAGEGAGFVQDGAIAVDGRTIIAVGPRIEIESNDRPRRTVDARGRLVMPGLIDAHLHSAATVARGWAQEVAPWMAGAYGPIMQHADEEDADLWTMLALMEGVANGTTCFGDYEAPMDRIVHSHIAMGNRAVLCEGVSELNWSRREEWIAAGWRPGDPTPLDRTFGEATLQRELGFYDRWHGFDNGRLTYLLGPHAADFLSTELLLRIQSEARKRGTSLHLHVAQDERENRATIERSGLRAIPYLDSIGLLAPDLIAVHLSTATPDEVRLVAERGSRMICCSNSIGIIDGIVPPAALFRDLGGVVGLGSDQSAGNNSHNIFSEMRATAMFAKITAEDPLAMPAWQVLRMATIDGARALGIGDRIGSLEQGKEADLILIDLTRPPLAPLLLRPARNVVPNLVYAETGANVTTTMVAGTVIYDHGRFTRIDVDEVTRRAARAAERFQDAVSTDLVVAELSVVEQTRRGLL